MLKFLTALSALAIVLASSARAEIQLEGNIEFTKKTKQCPASIKLNVQWRSRYHPGAIVAPGENIGDNNWSGINIVQDFQAMAFGRPGDFSTSFRGVNTGTLTDRFKGRTSEQDANVSLAKLRFLTMPADPVDALTPVLPVRGQIKNPLAKSTQKKCIVDFTGNYQNRDYLVPH